MRASVMLIAVLLLAWDPQGSFAGAPTSLIQLRQEADHLAAAEDLAAPAVEDAALAAALEPPPMPAPDRVITLSSASAAAAGAVQGDFVPGEYIVRLSSEPTCSSGSNNPADSDPEAKATQLQEQFSSIQISHIYRGLFKGFLLVIPDQQQQQQQDAAAAAAAGDSLAVQVLQALEADPCIRRVEPNRKVFAVGLAKAVAAGETVPVGIQRVKAASKNRANAAASVGIAVIDTGIAPHPDLNIASGVDCNKSPCVESGGPIKPVYLDQNGHGTHVAGVSGAKNNGKDIIGVAPGSRMFAVKALNAEGEGSFANIIRGLDWVQTYNSKVSDPLKKIRVVNLSLGGTSDHKADTKLLGPGCKGGSSFHKAICELTRDKENGAVVVVAATNDAVDLETAVPAAYPEVLTVTAIADNDGKGPGLAATGSDTFTCGSSPAVDDEAASFSNFVYSGSAAERHTVAAPGVCITSTWPGGMTARLSGTSMAAPHVAGIVALCFGKPDSSNGGSGGVTPGPCQAAWNSGTAQGIVKLFVNSKRFRQTGRAGFNGDRDNCEIGSSKRCKHYGYLVTAESL